MERSLGLMCGAGVLPARMADEARRRGWRVVAFTFDEAPGVAERAERVVASRVTEFGAVFTTLREQRISAVLFSGRFSMPDVLRADGPWRTPRPGVSRSEPVRASTPGSSTRSSRH